MVSVWIGFTAQTCVLIGIFSLIYYSYRHEGEIRYFNWLNVRRTVEFKPVHLFAIGSLFAFLIVLSLIRALRS